MVCRRSSHRGSGKGSWLREDQMHPKMRHGVAFLFVAWPSVPHSGQSNIPTIRGPTMSRRIEFLGHYQKAKASRTVREPTHRPKPGASRVGSNFTAPPGPSPGTVRWKAPEEHSAPKADHVNAISQHECVKCPDLTLRAGPPPFFPTRFYPV